MKLSHRLVIRLQIIAAVALLIQTAVPFMVGTASAAGTPWTNVQIILNRLQASTATTGTVCAKFSAANITTIGTTSTTLSLVFPTGFTVSTTNTNWAISTTSSPEWPSGAVAWTGVSAPTGGTGVVGQQVNFNVTGASNPSSAGTYCFNWTNTAALTNAAANNSLTGSMTMASGTYPGSTAQLTSNYAVATVTSDQVTVTATVPPIFTFSISGTTQPFSSNLSNSSATATSSLNVQVATNAASGYVCYVQDANFKTVTDAGSSPANRHGALTSATAGNYAISNNTASSLGTASHTLAANTEDYGFAVTTLAQGGTGTGTLTDTASNQFYDSVAATKIGVLDPTQLRPFASSSGSTSGDTITFVERAEVNATTPAATDYGDTLTIVAAGLF